MGGRIVNSQMDAVLRPLLDLGPSAATRSADNYAGSADRAVTSAASGARQANVDRMQVLKQKIKQFKPSKSKVQVEQEDMRKGAGNE